MNRCRISMFRCFLLVLAAFSVMEPRTGFCREILPLNSQWHFLRSDVNKAITAALDDSQWEQVNLPHTYNDRDILDERPYYQGPSWYRRKLNIENLENRRFFLRFEGANAVADVFVNEHMAGTHIGGYSAFCFEITDHLRQGKENLIAVRVDNSNGYHVVPNYDYLFTRYGGIYRPAELIVTSDVCITPLDYASPGVYLRQIEVTPQRARITAAVKVSNGAAETKKVTVRATVLGADGVKVTDVSASADVHSGDVKTIAPLITIDSPTLWQGKANPYLYTVQVQAIVAGEVVDEVVQPLGLRSFHVDPKKGFYLNGKHLDLHGVTRHQEWQGRGSALLEEHHRRDFDFFLEIGLTAIRLAHYQQAETIYDLADQHGIVVWAEIPMSGDYVPDSPAYRANARQQLRELIRQNYNHPSICFWGVYNEVTGGLDLIGELAAIVKEEDPTRLSTAASNKKVDPEKHFATDVIAWNRYWGWYGGGLERRYGEFVAEIHAEYPQACIGISEYGAGGCIDQHDQNPKRPDPRAGRFYPEEYQAYYHEIAWPQMAEQPALWCKFLWNEFDFTVPHWTRGNRPHMNHKGLVTFDRQIRKDAFFYYKANWSEEPVLHITSRRHVNRTNPKTPVKVYSNLEEVILTVNGKEIKSVKPTDYRVLLWPEITLKPGKNTIRADAKRKGQTFVDECVWFLR